MICCVLLAGLGVLGPRLGRLLRRLNGQRPSDVRAAAPPAEVTFSAHLRLPDLTPEEP